jgi:hypothetical protein
MCISLGGSNKTNSSGSRGPQEQRGIAPYIFYFTFRLMSISQERKDENCR